MSTFKKKYNIHLKNGKWTGSYVALYMLTYSHPLKK